MTQNTTRPRIIVGVSHSPAAAAALRWALGQATLRGAAIEAVHAWQWSGRHRAFYAPMGTWRSHEEEHESARERTRRIVARVLPALEPIVAHGPPAQVLLSHCHDAELLVLGIRGPAPGAPGTTTPVLAACLAGARCPVVVVPAPAAPLPAFPSHGLRFGRTPIG